MPKEFHIAKQKLAELYWEKGLSQADIEKIYNVSPQHISDLMMEQGVPTRDHRKAMALALAKGKGNTRRGSKHNAWKGGRHVSSGGYVLIYFPNHPAADKNRYVSEHRLVWEQTHNRLLPEGWVIHHLNGIKTDNRPENLVAMPLKKHSQREMGEYYKKRIRELEAKVKLLERTLDSQQFIFWSEN